MSEDLVGQRRQAATGLSSKPFNVKPLEFKAFDDEPIKSEPPPPEPKKRAAGTATAHLPLISKPDLRPITVAGRCNEEVFNELKKLSALTGRSISYLISVMIESTLPAWISSQTEVFQREQALKKEEKGAEKYLYRRRKKRRKKVTLDEITPSSDGDIDERTAGSEDSDDNSRNSR